MEAQAKRMKGDPNAELKAKLLELQQQVEAGRTAAPVVPPHLKYLKPDEQGVYAGEAESVELRMAKGIAEAAIAQTSDKTVELENQILQLRQQMAAGTRDTSQDLILSELVKIKPNAREIDENPIFDQWLLMNDAGSVTGATYADRVDGCMKRGDVAGLKTVMEQFEVDFPMGDHPAVAAQVKPPKVTATETKTQADPVIVDESEATRFYSDLARGRLKDPTTGRPMTKEQEASTLAIIEHAEKTGNIRRGY